MSNNSFRKYKEKKELALPQKASRVNFKDLYLTNIPNVSTFKKILLSKDPKEF
jgi:hypothetical protein